MRSREECMAQLAPLVFVSSTREDLEPYRQTMIRNLPRLDVLYRGMEFFGPRHERPKIVMLDEVAACDLFIGIIAHHYGSIDPESGVSYTELEYREAVRNRIPTFMFVISASHAVCPDTIDDEPVKRAKLEAFKATVRKEHAVVDFTTPEHLVSEVVDAIRNWLHDSEASWRTRGPDTQEKGFIRALYSDVPDIVSSAIKKLQFIQSSLALEHFYGLLNRPDLLHSIELDIFEALTLSREHQRVQDILDEMLARADPYLCSYAIHTAGDRALIEAIPFPDRLAERVLHLMSDDRDAVRAEVAHALYKFARRQPLLRHTYIGVLQLLRADPSLEVQRKARHSLEMLNAADVTGQV
jgi:hypothetical protein